MILNKSTFEHKNARLSIWGSHYTIFKKSSVIDLEGVLEDS